MTFFISNRKTPKNCEICNSKIIKQIKKLNEVYTSVTLKCSNNECGQPYNSWLVDNLELEILDSIGNNITYLNLQIIPNYMDFVRINESILSGQIEKYRQILLEPKHDTNEEYKIKKIIAAFINNYYHTIMQLINKVRDLFNDEYWKKITKSRGFTKQLYSDLLDKSGLSQTFDKYNIRDTRGGFTHGRDAKRIDSISKISFRRSWNKSSEETKIQVLMDEQDIEEIISKISKLLPIFIKYISDELGSKFKDDIDEFHKLKYKRHFAQKKFKSTGITITESDITKYDITDGL